MTNEQRDEFSINTKEILAKRVSYCCSNPKCGCITSGPHSDKNKAVNIGVAAHIRAAAPGGKRYDPNMTKQERKDISNGIWLCQSCSKLIDSDDVKYTVELLHKWKRMAEEKTAKKLESRMAQECFISKESDAEEDANVVLDVLDRLIEKIPRLKTDVQVIKYKIKENDYIGALTDLEQIRGIGLEIDEVRIWLNYVLKNYELIISETNKDIKRTSFINCIIGKTYMILEEYDRALEFFLQINESNVSYEKYCLLLRCYKEKGNREEQRKILEKLQEFPVKEELTYYEWGCFYMYSEKSIELFSEAIKYNKKFAKAYLERGKVKRYYGSWESAIDDLEKYLEISLDYENTQVMLELALAYYNKGEDENVYLGRWIDRMVITNPNLFTEDGKSLLVCDIGFEYSNKMCLTKNGDYIIININDADVMKVSCKNRALSGIGLYSSQTNEFLLGFASDMRREEIREKASLPAFYRIFSSIEEYESVKKYLLSKNVLHINHASKNYEEYSINDEDISVNIVKRLKSLNAIIKIGDYIIDEWIPITDEGFQAFLRKLSQGTMFDEAVIVLVGPQQECQLTFNMQKIAVEYK